MLDEEDIQQQLMDTVGEEFLQRLSALVAQEHLLTKVSISSLLLF